MCGRALDIVTYPFRKDGKNLSPGPCHLLPQKISSVGRTSHAFYFLPIPSPPGIFIASWIPPCTCSRSRSVNSTTPVGFAGLRLGCCFPLAGVFPRFIVVSPPFADSACAASCEERDLTLS